jgi:opacity protein-like surface antigen
MASILLHPGPARRAGLNRRKESDMRRGLAVLTLGLLALPAARASGSGLDVRLGAFFPRAESNLFQDDSELYTVEKDDWQGFSGGIEFNAAVARNVELGIHLDGYERTLDTSYRDFTTENDREIRQTLKFQVVPLGVTLRLIPTSSRVRVAPYIAVGADLFFWKYEEFGDFVDFDDPDLPIIADAFVSDGVAGGGHAAAGVRLRVSHDFSVVGEARYQATSKVDMGDDFAGNQLDLNGWTASVGVHVKF